jgi:hypothetical protein
MITPAGGSVGGLIMTSVGGIVGGRMITPFPEAARNPTAPVRTVRAKPHTAIHLFINPSEREIRSRGVYVRFRAIPRKYLRGVCPNGTHPSLGIGQSRFPNLSTGKIELGIESGQCYQRTIAANRLGSFTSGRFSGLSGFPGHQDRVSRNNRFAAIPTSPDCFRNLQGLHPQQVTTTRGRKSGRKSRTKIPRELSVSWRADGPSSISRVREVSVSGIFVSTDKPPKKGSRIQLLFSLPAGEVRVDGVVRHTRAGRGMGVEFTRVAKGDYARMREVIRRWKG